MEISLWKRALSHSWVLILPSLARVGLSAGAEGESTLTEVDNLILGSLEFQVGSSLKSSPYQGEAGRGYNQGI